jgi:hypothetical protein
MMGSAVPQMGSPMAMMSGIGSGVPSKPAPTYDGKTYTAWLAELERERKPERLTEAIRAFGVLVNPDDDKQAAEAAKAIMQIMRRYGSLAVDNGPQGKLIQQAQTVLTKLPPPTIVAAIEEELKGGTTQSRGFSMFVLGARFARSQQATGFGFSNQAVTTDKLALALDEREVVITQALLDLPAEETMIIRNYGLQLVINRAKVKNTPLQQVPGLLQMLRKLLETEKDSDLRDTAIQALVIADPDNKLLLPTLLRNLASKQIGRQETDVYQLAQLGPRAAPAVKPLMELLSAQLKKLKAGDVASSDGGGFGNPAVNSCHAAIYALGKIGPDAKDALPLLQSLKEPDEPISGFGLWDNGGAKLAVERIEGRASLEDPPSSGQGGGFGSQGGFF